jgi:probable rRNA maturation factor
MPTKRTPQKTRRRNSIAVQSAVAGAPPAELLRRFARAALQTRGRACITLRIVGAAEGKRLTKTFRNRNTPTNVLSFPYGGGRGDVVLCHPVIAREAKAQRKTLRAHYAHLVVHGVLHLRGHDHLRKSEAARMERTEIRLLRSLGFGDPYAVK